MRFGPSLARCLAAAILLEGSAMVSSHAQDAGGRGPALNIELNSLQPSEGGCRVSFVATNGHEADISKAAFEVVLFDTNNRVERLTVLDFQDLPAGRARVRQFDLRNAACDGISRVLLNGATACEGSGVTPDMCGRVETSTAGAVAFSG